MGKSTIWFPGGNNQPYRYKVQARKENGNALCSAKSAGKIPAPKLRPDPVKGKTVLHLEITCDRRTTLIESDSTSILGKTSEKRNIENGRAIGEIGKRIREYYRGIGRG